jgi:site-specific DNA-methyltransferase (adenine-specific)
MAVRIEDAGFEIRDLIMWCYGSGFPKSLDVSKAIDRMAGAEREVVGSRKLTGTARIKGQAAFGATSGRSEEAYQDGSEINDTLQITAPATPEAQQWAGWGTALKPALEPVTMARKPLQGTVAANVLEHGTGALNVDGCRVEGAPPSRAQPVFNSPTGRTYGMKTGEGRNGEMSQASGRWPANLIHDGSDEVVGLFPQVQGAVSTGRKGVPGIYMDGLGSCNQLPSYADSGSAARFFYTAKATRAERQGVTHPTVKPLDLMTYLCRLVTPPGGTVLDPFMGSGTTIKAAISEGFNAIGIERDPAYFAMAEHRMNGAQLGLLLTTP